MKSVSDNGLICIAMVYAIIADVVTGLVNEIGGARVIVVQGGEPSARECALKWFVGVWTNI